MSGVDPRRYQPVCVEDWDDEAEAPLPGTRTTANVAVKRDLSAELESAPPVIRYKNDGTDSGYASQAPTISSRASMASSNRRRNSELRLDTVNIVERERKPYAMTATPRDIDRSSSKSKPADTKEAKAVKKPFCHKEGICWVCDKYGYHFDPKDLPKKETSKPAAPTPQQPPPQPRGESSKTKLEEVPRPVPHRMSSNQQRPVSMYAAAPPVQAPYPQYPSIPPQAWPSVTPPPSAPPYSYYMPPNTPVYGMPPPQQQYPQQYYAEPQSVFEEFVSQPRPSRRTSMIAQERPVLEKKTLRQHTMLERPMPHDVRPQIVTHKSTRSIEADKLAMPPPPKPTHATINTARPRPGRSHTYTSNGSSNRRSRNEEDSDEEYLVDPRALAAYREPPSPSRPPSSYRKLPTQHEALDRARPQHHEVVERPRFQEKAHSYQNGTSTVQVASSRAAPRRRTTESMPPPRTVDQDVADAEAYMRKRGSYPVNDLTAENLQTLKTVATRQVGDQRSDSGSTGSHVTHHSSSKDSSNGRGRGASNSSALGHAPKTSMNININGLNLNITDGGSNNGDGPPVKIDLGAIQLHMNNNNRDKENIDYRPKPQKQLERAPSMSSRSSRRNLTSNSLVSAGSQRREREEQLAIEGPTSKEPRGELVPRSSYVDEDERESIRRSAKSSRQTSRNTSHVRQPLADEMTMRSRANRAGMDYSFRREEPSVM